MSRSELWGPGIGKVSRYEQPIYLDPAIESTRPHTIPDHIPYICGRTGKLRIDRVPITPDEIRECGDALQAHYSQGEAE